MLAKGIIQKEYGKYSMAMKQKSKPTCSNYVRCQKFPGNGDWLCFYLNVESQCHDEHDHSWLTLTNDDLLAGVMKKCQSDVYPSYLEGGNRSSYLPWLGEASYQASLPVNLRYS